MTDTVSDEEAGRTLRRAFSAFATGVTIVAARRSDGAALGLTVNSFTSVSLSPPLALWCLDEGSARYGAFAEADIWGVTVLGVADEAQALRFSRAENGEIHDDELDDLSGAPVLRGGLADFACRTVERRKAGDHLVIIGEVALYRARPGDGLTFFRGRYGGARDPWT